MRNFSFKSFIYIPTSVWASGARPRSKFRISNFFSFRYIEETSAYLKQVISLLLMLFQFYCCVLSLNCSKIEFCDNIIVFAIMRMQIFIYLKFYHFLSSNVSNYVSEIIFILFFYLYDTNLTRLSFYCTKIFGISMY